MISFAESNNINDLKQLWRECFDADDTYLNLYFSTRYKDEYTLVYKDKNKAVAMLTMLPIEIICEKQVYNARYVFAVATLKQYRGRGICAELLKYADDYMSFNKIDASVLAPASASLFDFYEKHGYNRLFNMRQSLVTASELPIVNCQEITVDNISASEYALKRDNYFKDCSIYAKWEISQLECIKSELELFGGGLFSLKNNNSFACAAVEHDKDTVKIKEIITDNDIDTLKVINCISQKYKPKKIYINQCENQKEIFSSQILPYAMIKWYNKIDMSAFFTDKDKPYMSLVSD